MDTLRRSALQLCLLTCIGSLHISCETTREWRTVYSAISDDTILPATYSPEVFSNSEFLCIEIEQHLQCASKASIVQNSGTSLRSSSMDSVSQLPSTNEWEILNPLPFDHRISLRCLDIGLIVERADLPFVHLACPVRFSEADDIILRSQLLSRVAVNTEGTLYLFFQNLTVRLPLRQSNYSDYQILPSSENCEDCTEVQHFWSPTNFLLFEVFSEAGSSRSFLFPRPKDHAQIDHIKVWNYSTITNHVCLVAEKATCTPIYILEDVLGCLITPVFYIFDLRP